MPDETNEAVAGRPDWLAPGQIATGRLPVVGEQAPSEDAPDADAWRLTVAGLVEAPLTLALADVMALPRREVRPDLHCVTGWSRRGLVFGGVPLRALLDRAGVRAEARFVRFEAYSDRRHDTSLPLALARDDTWLVYDVDGAPLEAAHGGPLRTLTPSRYLYKSLKWVRLVELTAEDRLGFWEREEGYHNEADPWREQRYVMGSLRRSDVERFVAARRLAPYRGRLLLGVDLRGWEPLDRDLSGLVLRNCDLRRARLAGTSLRSAVLCRSVLCGADLSRADLREADLEGVDLAGADLRGADLRGASLVAARFARGDARALVAGMRWSPESGALEDAEAFLLASDAADPEAPEAPEAPEG